MKLEEAITKWRIKNVEAPHAFWRQIDNKLIIVPCDGSMNFQHKSYYLNRIELIMDIRHNPYLLCVNDIIADDWKIGPHYLSDIYDSNGKERPRISQLHTKHIFRKIICRVENHLKMALWPKSQLQDIEIYSATANKR